MYPKKAAALIENAIITDNTTCPLFFFAFPFFFMIASSGITAFFLSLS
jgi:hypothetical protein